MNYVVSVIGTHARPLDDSLIQDVFLFLQTHGITVLNKKWLSPSRALDIFICQPAIDFYAQFKAFLFARQVDVIIQPEGGRRKKILTADMESTIIKEEMLEEMAAHLGIRDKIEDITLRAMNGELDFVAALAERLILLKGISLSVIQELGTRVTIMPGAQALVTTMRAHGAYCVLVSGGFRIYTRFVAEKLRFDVEYGNELDVKNDCVTGELSRPVLDKNSKKEILERTTLQFGLLPIDVCAVGDGANDIPMLQTAGLGVAYHAKPIVQKEIAHALNLSDLRGLLYAQGYDDEEIIEG